MYVILQSNSIVEGKGAEEIFKKLSKKEWRKSDVKTLVNLDDTEINILDRQEASQLKNSTRSTYVVVSRVN